MSDIVLEPAAQESADATAKPPLLYELGVEGARKPAAAGSSATPAPTTDWCVNWP